MILPNRGLKLEYIGGPCYRSWGDFAAGDSFSRFGPIAVGLLILAAHATLLIGQNGTAEVGQVSGEPEVITPALTHVLHAGERIDALGQPLIKTDAHSTVVLNLAGSRLLIGTNAAVRIRRLDFQHGRIRIFELRQGQLWASVSPQHGPTARYEIVCNGVSIQVHGTRFTVSSEAGGARVSTLKGTVRVTSGVSEALVGPKDSLLAVAYHRLRTTTPLTAAEATRLSQQFSRIDTNGLFTRLGELYNAAQEATLIPVMDGVLTLTHLRSGSQAATADADALRSARSALIAIHKLLLARKTLPATLNVETFTELKLQKTQVNRLLSSFAGNRLLAYKNQGHAAYTILARANDTDRTLISETNGNLAVISAEDEDGVLAKFAKDLPR